MTPADKTSEATMSELGPRAKAAAAVVGGLAPGPRGRVLSGLARLIETRAERVLRANALDLAAAAAGGTTGPKLKRLALTAEGVAQLAAGVRAVAAQPEVAGEVVRGWTAASGLDVQKVRTPLGVVCMIYEARPGVTVDAFALCFKAGNACILKGGREAAHSNTALMELVSEALRSGGVPVDAAQLVTTSDRDALKVLLADRENIDLVIPRGGTELIRFVSEHSKIPTLQHYQGVCHVYVHSAADLEMAERICVTGKASAPATCNATECVLVDAAVAEQFVPQLVAAFAGAGVEVRGDAAVQLLGGVKVSAAAVGDFGCEFLDLVVAMRVVSGLDEAVEHIRRYTSDHTEAIVTEDASAAERFVAEVRSSCVLVNASTRNNDGGALGLGAEIGISTTRLHAYGPMGAEQLTVERFVVRGRGQCR